MITVDRIVEEIAVLIFDNGIRKEVSVAQLPNGVREGSVLIETSDGFILDELTTNDRRIKIAKRMKSLFKKK